jgi:hypothetical protein
MIVLGITSHTAAGNPSVRVNMDIHLMKDDWDGVQCKEKTKVSNLAEYDMKSHETSSSWLGKLTIR